MKRLQILSQLFLEKAAENRLNRRIHLLFHLFKALIFLVHTPLSNWFKVIVITPPPVYNAAGSQKWKEAENWGLSHVFAISRLQLSYKTNC